MAKRKREDAARKTVIPPATEPLHTDTGPELQPEDGHEDGGFPNDEPTMMDPEDPTPFDSEDSENNSHIEVNFPWEAADVQAGDFWEELAGEFDKAAPTSYHLRPPFLEHPQLNDRIPFYIF